MMMKVESYMYNGRLTKISWEGTAVGRCYNSIVRVIFVIMFVAPVIVSCSDNKSQKQDRETELLAVSTPAPVEQPLYVPPTTDVPPQRVETVQNLHRDETPVVEHQAVQPTVTISKYYEKGYDAGYDDGGDDAVMESGWGGQWD